MIDKKGKEVRNLFKITLEAARVNAGYTQRQAANALNKGVSTIINWEKGKTMPTQPDIEALCTLYKMPYDYIRFS